MIKCQTKLTLEIAIDMFWWQNNANLNLNFWEEKETDTIDIFDYQTANAAGTALPPTPSFLKEMKTTGFYLKNSKSI